MVVHFVTFPLLDFFLFWSYFDVVSKVSRLLDYINSVSTFTSPFLSVLVHFGKFDTNMQINWPCQRSACTPQMRSHGENFEAKQGRPLCHFSVQYIQHTYSRPLYSVQICRLDILVHFGTKYITFPYIGMYPLTVTQFRPPPLFSVKFIYVRLGRGFHTQPAQSVSVSCSHKLHNTGSFIPWVNSSN